MDRRTKLLSDAESRRKRLTQIYKDAENAAIVLLAAALLAPKPAGALLKAKASIKKIMGDAEKQAQAWSDDSLTTLYARGMMDTSERLNRVYPESSPMHLAIIAALGVEVMDRLTSVSAAVDRNVTTLLSAAQVGEAGAAFKNATDWQALAEQLRKDVLANGVTGFIDKAGHSWKVDTYVDVVAQSSVMRAYNKGISSEMQAQGLDLARLSDEIDENTCDACAQWAGQVLSITGETPGFPTVDEAEADGVFHCHCVHTLEPLTEEEAAQEVADNGNSDPEAKEA
jgi:uncharacterized glyoxalase superfamily protein PhnB